MMETLPITQAFTLIEPGPVALVTTCEGSQSNIMTISWTMVLDFSPRLALSTGPWNYSYGALKGTRECVIAIPAVDQIDEVIGIGMCSGSDTDKFARFGLTAGPAQYVKAPLISECLANIECRVLDIVADHNIIVLQGIHAWYDAARPEKRTLHAVGDGTFVADGDVLNRREAMWQKIPDGV